MAYGIFLSNMALLSHISVRSGRFGIGLQLYSYPQNGQYGYQHSSKTEEK